MAIYKEDLVDIELETGSIFRNFLNQTIGEGDKAENRFGIRAFRNGEPENLEGATCIGYFIRPIGGTVVIDGGVVSGNTAYITLPQACYVYEGNFSLAIKLVGTNITGTMRIVDGVVLNTTTETLIDPGSVIPDISDLLALIEDAESAIQGAVHFDITQELTDSEQAKARGNISAVSTADFSELQDAFDALGLYVEDGYVCQKLASE